MSDLSASLFVCTCMVIEAFHPGGLSAIQYIVSIILLILLQWQPKTK